MPTSTEMSTTLALTGVVVITLAVVVAALADAPTWKEFVKVMAISALVLLTFIGLGAVFGKTLGDFLRHPNG